MVKKNTNLKFESIKTLSLKSKNIKEFTKNYFDRLTFVFNSLDFKKFKKLEKILDQTRINRNTIFVFGNGGKLKKISDLSIHIKSNKLEYGPVEDIHLIINHIFAHWFQKKLK